METKIAKLEQYTLTHYEIERLQAIATAANQTLADNVFSLYQQTKAPNTIRRQRADLMLFGQFISEISGVALDGCAFCEHPGAWAIVTGGLVTAYRQWMLKSGYDAHSVNVRLSTVRTYAKLAHQAGMIAEGEYLRITGVSGYSQKEIGRIDAKREVKRIGEKKENANFVKRGIVAQLKGLECKRDSDYRDRVLLCLMLDHGLRVSEVEALTVGSVDMNARTLTINRLKTSTTDLHDLTDDTYAALVDYMPLLDGRAVTAPLIAGSLKSGRLTDGGMSVRAINARVQEIGQRFGIENLSPHDLRHTAADEVVKNNDLQTAAAWGGWSSLAMPMRYAEKRKVSNRGVKITY
jgi:integrase